MTKKKIAWITDSVSCISPELSERYGIHIVPLSIIFDNKQYRDGEDLTYDEFYDLLNKSDKSPTTSQPAIGEFVELYTKLKEEYEMGIAIHVTSKVSGTFNTSIMAAEMAEFPMVHIDSKIGAKALEFMMLEGIRLENEGKTIDEITNHLNTMASTVKGYAIVGSLEQLNKGGRVSGLGLLLGNLLQIKPILGFDDGSLVPYEKVRTLKKAEKRILEIFKESCDSKNVYGVSICHANHINKANEFKEKVLDINSSIQVEIGDLSPVISAHVGEGSFVLFWFEK
ncbi:DegV family protein [Bacillus cereus group sp. TH152-1LC]|uniref:DegV family protein n=1 Tax=Bacillus cereus group sp. TH152-1LC TaxID=3018060 RepID=UPI0022E563D3|nr:DegV family protein [Bacillus cereus group sp. TH152-1LC]MDA1674848.1 DegV family protein [Bacillus cereus group sp. TH152-1LC]